MTETAKQRLNLIIKIIELHNFFVVNYMNKIFGSGSDNLFNLDLLQLKPDRYYLIESLRETKDVPYENKTFEPMVAVRYHLRSEEAKAYGDKHRAFFDRYLDTISVSYDDIDNPNEYKEKLLIEIAKHHEKV